MAVIRPPKTNASTEPLAADVTRPPVAHGGDAYLQMPFTGEPLYRSLANLISRFLTNGLAPVTQSSARRPSGDRR